MPLGVSRETVRAVEAGKKPLLPPLPLLPLSGDRLAAPYHFQNQVLQIAGRDARDAARLGQ